MPAFYEIRVLPDGPTLPFIGSSGNYYKLDDGTRLDLHTTPVWCQRCATFTPGEHIESIDEIDQSFASLIHPANHAGMPLLEFRGMPTVENDTFIQEKQNAIAKRRRWRQMRTSPPKCIHCGSHDILQLPLDTPIPNPSGVGTIEISCTGICSTTSTERFFTPEGNPAINSDTPNSSTHPQPKKTHQNQ